MTRQSGPKAAVPVGILAATMIRTAIGVRVSALLEKEKAKHAVPFDCNHVLFFFGRRGISHETRLLE